ncbi:hypothetical protein N9873_02260 [Akkermansiaceae bacterium]|nr:hypothetical protein [Akkermansiaceae bacterium]MDB4644363.1 hypothetical protein [bacterium]MDB4667621.1 hypothetical protein [Akkermansiaceae bacterium]MDC0274588.1 hypothetical protein [Akkermansiaceae bacterium]
MKTNLQAFQEMAGEEKARMAGFVSTAGSSVDQSFKGEAIKYLLENPEKQENAGWGEGRRDGGVNLASQHALNLMKTDPAGASTWLNSLPESNERLWAKKNFASNWQNYDPDAVQNWVASQPANERTEIESFLKEN